MTPTNTGPSKPKDGHYILWTQFEEVACDRLRWICLTQVNIVTYLCHLLRTEAAWGQIYCSHTEVSLSQILFDSAHSYHFTEFSRESLDEIIPISQGRKLRFQRERDRQGVPQLPAPWGWCHTVTATPWRPHRDCSGDTDVLLLASVRGIKL